MIESTRATGTTAAMGSEWGAPPIAAHYNTRRPHRALQLHPPRTKMPVPEPVHGKDPASPIIGGLINPVRSCSLKAQVIPEGAGPVNLLFL
jgi:hypothetical protein